MAERKAFLMRIDPALWSALEALAQRELRSVNAQIEFMLREGLSRRGVRPSTSDAPGDAAPRDD
ncbi:MAG TPA: hypothetical protein VGR63_00395 [Casimicrobiaceae bacterium]|jgi:hypothetical protein|nr:hypothetical protein [Casimicrobiaceae bacterium]